MASDGGIFRFGNAGFYGSIPGLGLAPAGSGLPHSLNARIVGMVPSADGGGYFMVGADGGVFTFGDAKYRGFLSGHRWVPRRRSRRRRCPTVRVTGTGWSPQGGYVIRSVMHRPQGSLRLGRHFSCTEFRREWVLPSLPERGGLQLRGCRQLRARSRRGRRIQPGHDHLHHANGEVTGSPVPTDRSSPKVTHPMRAALTNFTERRHHRRDGVVESSPEVTTTAPSS